MKELSIEEKSLLLKDLSARLPYGVIVDYKENEFEIPHWKITSIYPETMDGRISYDRKIGAGSESGSMYFNIGKVKPYLRPMSSMTEEERNELSHYHNDVQRTDFFYSHHIDCRFMIEKGLALEAPKGVYN